ncbi:MAG TPA: hypothetical protein VFA27_16220 [Vicinamibacterales bacterium]|nr:hypothetical protein [Vicinamibacterales bacterium]
MAVMLAEYDEPVVSDGIAYRALVYGARLDANLWEGWIAFVPADGGPTRRTSRETTQPNLTDTEYWATGLTHVYLEGALVRALELAATSPAER